MCLNSFKYFNLRVQMYSYSIYSKVKEIYLFYFFIPQSRVKEICRNALKEVNKIDG